MFRLPLFLVTLFVFLTASMTAQIEVRHERKGMVRGVHDALVIELAGADKSFAEKEWKDFMRKYGKVEKVKKTEEWLIQSAHLVNYPDIDYVNIYAEAFKEDTFSLFTVWIEADTSFISPDDEDAWASAEQMMRDFEVKVKIDLINIELDKANKDLTKLQSDLTRLENNHDKYVRTIDQSHLAIETAESDIVINQRDQEQLSNEMREYGSMEEDPDAQKELEKLEKRMKKLKKQNLNYHNDIAKYQDRIKQNEANIEQNTVDQENKKLEIEEQEKVVKKIRDRLSLVRAGKDA